MFKKGNYLGPYEVTIFSYEKFLMHFFFRSARRREALWRSGVRTDIFVARGDSPG